MTTYSLFSPKMFNAKYASYAVRNHCSNTCSLFKYIINFTIHQLFLKTLMFIHNKRKVGCQFYILLSNVTSTRIVSPFLQFFKQLLQISRTTYVIQALYFNYMVCLHVDGYFLETRHMHHKCFYVTNSTKSIILHMFHSQSKLISITYIYI
jgi:hypothetical protein